MLILVVVSILEKYFILFYVITNNAFSKIFFSRAAVLIRFFSVLSVFVKWFLFNFLKFSLYFNK